jgi:exocyst complex protein 7
VHGPRLEDIQAALLALEDAVCPTRAPMEDIVVAGSLIAHAIGPTTTAPKLFDAVLGIELPLLHVATIPVTSRVPRCVGVLCVTSPTSSSTSGTTTSSNRASSLADTRFLAKVHAALKELKKTFGNLNGGTRLLLHTPCGSILSL